MRRTLPTLLLSFCTMAGLLAAAGAPPASAGVTGTPAPARSASSARPGGPAAALAVHSAAGSTLPPRVNFHAWRGYAAFQSGAGRGSG